MGIKYATQPRSAIVGKAVALSNPQPVVHRLPEEQLLAIVASSIYSTGDCTIEWSISRAKHLIEAARADANK